MPGMLAFPSDRLMCMQMMSQALHKAIDGHPIGVLTLAQAKSWT